MRPLPDGAYEILSGHQRKRAAELLGLTEVPAVVADLSDEEAELAVIDANLESRRLTPMQIARAIRRKKELLGERRGRPKVCDGRTQSAGRTLGIAAEGLGLSSRQAALYDSLNDLIPELQALADSNKLGLSAAEQLSRLPAEVQRELWRAVGEEISGLTREEVKRLRREADVGFTALEAMRLRIADLERELEERRKKEADISDLEERLAALRKKKRDLEYDISDRETAAKALAERHASPGAVFLGTVRSCLRALQSYLPEAETLADSLSASSLDPSYRHELSKWLELLTKWSGLIAPLVKEEKERSDG